jgi:hypothetical protein
MQSQDSFAMLGSKRIRNVHGKGRFPHPALHVHERYDLHSDWPHRTLGQNGRAAKLQRARKCRLPREQATTAALSSWFV